MSRQLVDMLEAENRALRAQVRDLADHCLAACGVKYGPDEPPLALQMLRIAAGDLGALVYLPDGPELGDVLRILYRMQLIAEHESELGVAIERRGEVFR